MSGHGNYSLASESSELALRQVAGELAVVDNILAEDLFPEPHDGLLVEERERLGDGNRGHSAVLKTNLLHRVDLGRRGVSEVLSRVEGALEGRLVFPEDLGLHDDRRRRPGQAGFPAEVRARGHDVCGSHCD